MTLNGYARPAAPVKLISYRVSLPGKPLCRVVASHRQMLHWLLTVLPSRKEASRAC